MRLRLPDRCKFCGSIGTLRPEHTIRAKTVTIAWCCNQCNRDWRITDEDYQPERRISVPDRRKKTRSDRRESRRI